MCHIDYSFDDPPTKDDADTEEYRNLDTPYHYENTGFDVQLSSYIVLSFISFDRGENLNFQINV